jgi:hypothetical protein
MIENLEVDFVVDMLVEHLEVDSYMDFERLEVDSVVDSYMGFEN